MSLVSFSRLLATASNTHEMLEMLAESVRTELKASASVVLTVEDPGHLRVKASAGIEGLDSLALELSDLGPELTGKLSQACGKRYPQAHTLPLVSGADLFGALVVFFDGPDRLTPEQHATAEGFADLAAVALARAHQYERLLSAHTELQTAYDTLAQTEKLRAVGQMTAGIAHDLRNVLGPLLIQAQMLKQVGGDVAKVEQIADRLDSTVRLGIDSINRLVDFCRSAPDPYAAELVDISALAADTIDLVKPRMSNRSARIVPQLGGPVQVRLPRSDLTMALLNLLINALDALPPAGGTVWVRSGREEHGGWLQVQDTGAGMPPEVQRRIFEPFYTTKGKAGTGLGLAMVAGFVRRLGGTIDVESEVGKGTVVTLRLPGLDGAGGSEPQLIQSVPTSSTGGLSHGAPHGSDPHR